MDIKQEFVVRYYNAALKAAKQTGISPVFILAQSALETGWGKSVKGNMLFGIKKGKGINYGGWQGATQLITTTEYSASPIKSFPYIYPGYPKQTTNGRWKYKIKAEFRAYATPYHSFMDWAGLLTGNTRYHTALFYRRDPNRFAQEIAAAGYATDPLYASKIQQLMQEVQRFTIHLKSKAIKKQNTTMPLTSILIITLGIGTVIVIGLIATNKIKL